MYGILTKLIPQGFVYYFSSSEAVIAEVLKLKYKI